MFRPIDRQVAAAAVERKFGIRGRMVLMVGDLQRIRIYPAKGFQIPQEIPEDVWSAFEKLVAWGFTGHLAS